MIPMRFWCNIKRDFFNIRILSENYAEVEDDKADNLYELNGSKVKDTSSDYRYMIVNKDGVVLHNNKGKKYNSVYNYKDNHCLVSNLYS